MVVPLAETRKTDEKPGVIGSLKFSLNIWHGFVRIKNWDKRTWRCLTFRGKIGRGLDRVGMYLEMAFIIDGI